MSTEEMLEDFGVNDNKFKLNFNHPMKEMDWMKNGMQYNDFHPTITDDILTEQKASYNGKNMLRDMYFLGSHNVGVDDTELKKLLKQLVIPPVKPTNKYKISTPFYDCTNINVSSGLTKVGPILKNFFSRKHVKQFYPHASEEIKRHTMFYTTTLPIELGEYEGDTIVINLNDICRTVHMDVMYDSYISFDKKPDIKYIELKIIGSNGTMIVDILTPKYLYIYNIMCNKNIGDLSDESNHVVNLPFFFNKMSHCLPLFAIDDNVVLTIKLNQPSALNVTYISSMSKLCKQEQSFFLNSQFNPVILQHGKNYVNYVLDEPKINSSKIVYDVTKKVILKPEFTSSISELIIFIENGDNVHVEGTIMSSSKLPLWFENDIANDKCVGYINNMITKFNLKRCGISTTLPKNVLYVPFMIDYNTRESQPTGCFDCDVNNIKLILNITQKSDSLKKINIHVWGPRYTMFVMNNRCCWLESSTECNPMQSSIMGSHAGAGNHHDPFGYHNQINYDSISYDPMTPMTPMTINHKQNDYFQPSNSCNIGSLNHFMMEKMMHSVANSENKYDVHNDTNFTDTSGNYMENLLMTSYDASGNYMENSLMTNYDASGNHKTTKYKYT
jgi:hypothetical protein